MGANLRLRAVVFGQLRNGDPAVCTKAGGLLRHGADREEQTTAFAPRKTGIDQGINISRKADRRLLANAIGPAASDFARGLRRKERETEPGLVLKAMAFSGVERDANIGGNCGGNRLNGV